MTGVGGSGTAGKGFLELEPLWGGGSGELLSWCGSEGTIRGWSWECCSKAEIRPICQSQSKRLLLIDLTEKQANRKKQPPTLYHYHLLVFQYHAILMELNKTETTGKREMRFAESPGSASQSIEEKSGFVPETIA